MLYLITHKKGVPFLIVAFSGLVAGAAFSLKSALPAAFLFLVFWYVCGRLVKGGPLKKRMAKDSYAFLPFFILALTPVIGSFFPAEFSNFADIPLHLLLSTSISAFVALKILFFPRKIGIKRASMIVFLAVAVYFVVFSSLSILKHEAMNSTAFDLGIFDQTIWGYSRGENVFNTVRGIVLLGDHAQPISLFLAPLYWVYPDVNAILILQTLLLALAGLPLYALARKALNDTAALFITLAYLLYPVLHYMNLFDFHPAALTVFPLMLALYALREHRYALFLLSVTVVALAKEHYSLLLITFGAYIFIFHKKKFIGAITAAFGMLWFVFNVKFLIPHFSGGFQYLKGYSYLGSGFQEMIVNSITNPFLVLSHIFTFTNLTYLALLAAPFAFGAFIFFAPEIILIAAPSFAINMLREASTFTAIIYQHNAEIIPFLFVSAVIGIKRISKYFPSKNTVVAASLFVLLASAGAGFSYGPFATIYGKETFIADARASAAKALIGQIPSNASVSASTWAVPHLSHRNEIYVFPNPFYQHIYGPNYLDTEFRGEATDYVLIDTSREDPLMPELFRNETISFMLSNENYTTIDEREGWVLLRK